MSEVRTLVVPIDVIAVVNFADVLPSRGLQFLDARFKHTDMAKQAIDRLADRIGHIRRQRAIGREVSLGLMFRVPVVINGAAGNTDNW